MKEVRKAHLAEEPAETPAVGKLPPIHSLHPIDAKQTVKDLHAFKFETERRDVRSRKHTRRTTPGDSDLPLDHPHGHPHKIDRILNSSQHNSHQ